MARLQILELPEGTGDDRPPFVLIVDECVPHRRTLGAEASYGDQWQSLADRIGARGVIVTPETVQIPADRPLPGDDSEHAGTTEIVYAHERTRLDLCNALLLSGDTTWRQLTEAVSERQKAIASVLNLPEQPDIMDAQHPDSSGYLHGYGVAIRDAQRAAGSRKMQAAKGAG